MARKSFPLSKVYGLLDPGPILMVTTAREGRPNIMTMSWHTMNKAKAKLTKKGGCNESEKK